MDPIYIAGFFDGEGCVGVQRGLNKNGRVYYTMNVTITNSYLPTLQLLKAQYGGSIKSRRKISDKHKQVYAWRACSLLARRFLLDIVPHLRQKKAEAELAIRFQDQMRHLGNRHQLTPPEVVAARDAIHLEMSRLKTVEFVH